MRNLRWLRHDLCVPLANKVSSIRPTNSSQLDCHDYKRNFFDSAHDTCDATTAVVFTLICIRNDQRAKRANCIYILFD